ncbi:type III-A CRISPR-associated protein Cas10/Csm1 [Oceanicella actignis]|uniref:CRISPR system single-strand-specific deoxyribonuclease Cas10/Csm1 (subtype III-A) n=1 Tax=Oceanicella actignis TaxID=1189325 RepID=A0A1M7S233_9RHOB|nr:type III-A CRISPR-associated protein Cas10/Csm1 [Oceanicella actignis]SES91400.1 CRISPR-associated protein Cas10/Csm1, subtype III-A/MTUBE [Oceanicella actignis]SHN52435.1 CRISPR-associated protein Csm1 [Oceanicella actignis]
MNKHSLPTVHEVALAGLLHDIGKLIQRAVRGGMPKELLDRQSDVLPMRNGRPSHWHALWSDWFFDQCEAGRLFWPAGADRAWVRNLAVYHHRPLQAAPGAPGLALSEIVTLADRMAAGFERKTKDVEAEETWNASGPARSRFRRTPIEAIATSVRLGDAHAKRGHHLPGELAAEALAPASRIRGEDVESGYARVWDQFQSEWNDAARRCANNPSAFEECVLSLSERFLWSIPSSTMDQPDVSLHDHSRAAAAFAGVLYRYHERSGTLFERSMQTDRSLPAFRFLIGDLSGLQATLFRLQSEGVKGLNKTLRGRSLRFQLIADAAIRQALRAFGLPMSAALQAAGGRFLALVPNVADAEDIVDALRRRFDAWFIEQYSGELALGLALSDPFSAGDLIATPNAAGAPQSRAEAVRESIAMTAEMAKLRLFAEQAAQGVVRMEFTAAGACTTCGVRPAVAAPAASASSAEKDGLCRACAGERLLGAHLPKSRAVVIREAKAGAASAETLLWHDYLLPMGEGEDRHDHGLGWRWLLDKPAHGPAPLRPGPAWVARFEDDVSRYEDLEDVEPSGVKTFEALARDAREIENGRPFGREMLALVKGDVDRLGRIFAGGLGERWSIARSAALSRMIDAYFTLRLPWLLRERFPDSYTVYAGGDDFMLVLPWRQGLELARALREDFSIFSGGNPDLTFSVGIALFDPRTPISIAAREAEKRLAEAKDAGRDRISAIEASPMEWSAFSRALDRACDLNRWIRDRRLPIAMLYRLLAIDDARQRVARGAARSSDYAWMARLGYQMARNLKGPENEDIRQAILGLFGLDDGWSGADRVVPGARLAISHAIYRNR